MAGNINELGRRIDQALTAKVNRRTALKGGALGALATFAAACNIGQPSPSPEASKTPALATASPTATAEAAKPTATATAEVAKPTPTATAAATAAAKATGEGAKALAESKPLPEAFRVPWGDGKYRTFDRSEVVIDGKRLQVLIQPDLGTLGPDVDVVFAIDFPGDIDTEGIEVISSPGAGNITETRVVGVKRTDLTYVQFKDALGGDAFDEWKNVRFGGDEGLAARARFHAENSAHTHQKVVNIGDLGAFQKKFGETSSKIKAFLQRIIKAERWADGVQRLEIPDSNFVQPRKF